jgi:hypothetical protein
MSDAGQTFDETFEQLATSRLTWDRMDVVRLARDLFESEMLLDLRPGEEPGDVETLQQLLDRAKDLTEKAFAAAMEFGEGARLYLTHDPEEDG